MATHTWLGKSQNAVLHDQTLTLNYNACLTTNNISLHEKWRILRYSHENTGLNKTHILKVF